jgi:peptidoglycan/xylan/chitin deacetylase (PgdA/CDA1 family)
MRCKGVSDAEKHEAIDRLAEAAGVELPSQAPPRYAAMTWSELRSWEQRGMTFGPHTVTHPILSKATDEQSRRELAGSWERLQVMATRPAPVFCYPNGQPGDYGAREYATLRDLGLRGAVVGTPGYASTARFHGRTEAPYQVRRFNYPEDSLVVAQYVSGAERLREWAGGQA